MEQISVVKEKETFCSELSGERKSLEQREGDAKVVNVGLFLGEETAEV